MELSSVIAIMIKNKLKARFSNSNGSSVFANARIVSAQTGKA